MAKAKETKTAKTTSKKKVESKKGVQIKFKKPSMEALKEFKETRAFKVLSITFIIVFCFVLVDYGVQYLNNSYSVAVVNGSRITRGTLNRRMEQAYGSSVVSQLIEEELIKQEAAREGITVAQEEIDEELQFIADQLGGEDQLEASLTAYNITRDELIEQIRLNLLAKNILEPTIEYTEEDLMEFFDNYSNLLFPQEFAELEEGEKLNYDTYRERTLETFVSQEIEAAKAEWLAELREEARIQDNLVSKPSYRFLGATRNILNNILNQANTVSEE